MARIALVKDVFSSLLPANKRPKLKAYLIRAAAMVFAMSNTPSTKEGNFASDNMFTNA
jgi:hypothetical protein